MRCLRHRSSLFALLLVAAGCAADGGAGVDVGARPVDAGSAVDANVVRDAIAAAADATPSDSCLATDGGATTWCDFAQQFFATYCVACHNAKDPTGRDWTSYAIVKSNAFTIECGVTPTPIAACASTRIMPAMFPIGGGPRPDDAERTRLVQWIDSGLPR